MTIVLKKPDAHEYSGCMFECDDCGAEFITNEYSASWCDENVYVAICPYCHEPLATNVKPTIHNIKPEDIKQII